MADPNPSTTIASAFPAPPPFYKHFTPTNLARRAEAQAEAQSSAQPSDPTSPPTDPSRSRPTLSTDQLAALPTELLYLIPPSPPPASTAHTLFSAPHTLDPQRTTLSSRHLESLIPSSHTDPDTALHPTTAIPPLLSLSKSLLLSFLELIALLSHNPALAAQKTEDLRILFVNAHDLLNRLREHGGREMLIGMMEKEVERRKGEVERVGGLRGRVEGVLGGLRGGGAEGEGKGGEGRGEGMGVNGVNGVDGMHVEVKEKERMIRERERRIFEALDEIDIG